MSSCGTILVSIYVHLMFVGMCGAHESGESLRLAPPIVKHLPMPLEVWYQDGGNLNDPPGLPMSSVYCRLLPGLPSYFWLD